jgi:hypothetical protein
VLGTVELRDCLPIPPFNEPAALKRWLSQYSANLDEAERGDYRLGRFAWVLRNPRSLATPIPARGRQSLWDWSPPDSGLLT